MASVSPQVEGLPRWEVVRSTATLPDGSSGPMVSLFPADDRWEHRAKPHPHVEIVGQPHDAEAVEVVVLSATMRGWALRLRFEPFDGVIELTEKSERRVPASAGVVVQFGADGPEVVGAVEDTIERRPLSSRLLRAEGFGHVSDEAKALLVDPVVLGYLGDAWQRPGLRPGRSQRSPHDFALWANRYVWALAEAPRRPVAHIVEADTEAGVYRTEKEVRGQVNRCRGRYLTRSPRNGMPGGELTDESRRLLAELGVAPGSDHIVRGTSQKGRQS